MEQSTEQTMTGELIELALRDPAEGSIELLRDALTELRPAEIANLLEGMLPERRRETWELVAEEARAIVLADVQEEASATLIGEMDEAQLVDAGEQMAEQDLAGVIEVSPEDLTETILSALNEDHRNLRTP